MSNLLDKLKVSYRSIWFHLIVNVFIFSVLSVMLPIHFETNDDVVMLLIASGKYSGVPDAHLVFINYFWGLIVTSFYVLYDGLEWYTIGMATLHIISWTIISSRVMKTTVHPLWKIASLVTLYFFGAIMIYYFQFTSTAALCATSAVLLYLLADKKYHRYFALAWFIIGSWIRLEAAFLVFLICSPMLLLYVIEHINKVTNVIFLSAFVAVALVFFFCR